MRFHDRLHELRTSRGFSQCYIADYMRVSQVTVSNWERGHKEPSFSTLIDLANLFGVTTDYMLGVSDEK